MKQLRDNTDGKTVTFSGDNTNPTYKGLTNDDMEAIKEGLRETHVPVKFRFIYRNEFREDTDYRKHLADFFRCTNSAISLHLAAEYYTSGTQELGAGIQQCTQSVEISFFGPALGLPSVIIHQIPTDKLLEGLVEGFRNASRSTQQLDEAKKTKQFTLSMDTSRPMKEYFSVIHDFTATFGQKFKDLVFVVSPLTRGIKEEDFVTLAARAACPITIILDGRTPYSRLKEIIAPVLLGALKSHELPPGTKIFGFGKKIKDACVENDQYFEKYKQVEAAVALFSFHSALPNAHPFKALVPYMLVDPELKRFANHLFFTPTSEETTKMMDLPATSKASLFQFTTEPAHDDSDLDEEKPKSDSDKEDPDLPTIW